MANSLSHLKKDIFHKISNSFTSVLYSTLLISGSQLAKNEWEKSFVIWLAQHDQKHLGLGLIGIDFDDVFWIPEDFENQKTFVVKIAERVVLNKSWTLLDYSTSPEILLKFINIWIEIFSNSSVEDINSNLKTFDWFIKPQGLLEKKCDKHKIFLNYMGETESSSCYLCNNN